jgi:hypothetical protein
MVIGGGRLTQREEAQASKNDGSGGGVIIRLSLVSLGSGSPNHDGVSKLKGRGYVPQSLYCLAGASNGQRTEAKDPPEN